LYWTEDGVIRHGDLDAGNATDVLSSTGSSWIKALAHDPVEDRLYWTNTADGEVWWAYADGTGAELVVDTDDPLVDLAVDPAGRQLYWAVSTLFGKESLYQGGMDGSGVTDLGHAPQCVEADSAAGYLYVGEGEAIKRMDLSGGNPVSSGSIDDSEITSVATHPATGRICWHTIRVMDGSHSTISCGRTNHGPSSFSVTDVTLVAEETPGGIDDIALDGAGDRVYWIARASSPGEATIKRASADGSGVTELRTYDKGTNDAILVVQD